MVKTIQKENKEIYRCEECGYRYEGKEWAEKCEAWCREHQSCNIEITSHACLADRQGMPPETEGARSQNEEDRKFKIK